MPIHFGGPVESSRGFVLHTADYLQDSSLVIEDEFALTATLDVLKAIARGEGPRRRVLALGYAGWAAGQLDAEIQANGWLLVPADLDLVFASTTRTNGSGRWPSSGIDLSLLSTEAGHA